MSRSEPIQTEIAQLDLKIDCDQEKCVAAQAAANRFLIGSDPYKERMENALLLINSVVLGLMRKQELLMHLGRDKEVDHCREKRRLANRTLISLASCCA